MFLVKGLAQLGKTSLTPLHNRTESSQDKSLGMSSRDKSLDISSRETSLGMSKHEMSVVMKMTIDMMMVTRLWRTPGIEERMKVHWDPELQEGCIRNMIADIG